MAYIKKGPFTNDAPPAVNKAFLDPLESYLAGQFQVGNIQKIAFGFASFTTSGTVVTHNLGSVPAGIFVTVAGLAGVTYKVDGYASNSTMTVTVSANCNGWWLVLA